MLYWVISAAVRVPGKTLQSKFADLGSVKGKKKEDIIAEVGQPNSVSATAGGGQVLQWMATGYHIVLEFDANGICQGVTHESAVGARLSTSSTTGSITTGPMAQRFVCPNCGVSRSAFDSSEEYMKIAKLRLGFCKTCYAVFKVSVDEKTGNWSYEPPPKNLTFDIRSPSLNADLTYTEPLMPDNVRENLLNISKQLEKGGQIGARAELENIFTTYPTQVSSVLNSKGLFRAIVPFIAICQRCGVGIPRARLGNCPICSTR